MRLVDGQVVVETDAKTDADFSDDISLVQFLFEVYQIGQDNSLRHQLGLDQPGGPNPPGPNPQNTPGGGPGPRFRRTNPPPATNPEMNQFQLTPPVVTTLALATSSFVFPFTSSPPFFSRPEAQTASHDVITLATPPSGGVVGPSGLPVAISLLGGVVDSNPGATVKIATNAAGAPAITVGVVSGSYNPASVVYTVNAAGDWSSIPRNSRAWRRGRR